MSACHSNFTELTEHEHAALIQQLCERVRSDRTVHNMFESLFVIGQDEYSTFTSLTIRISKRSDTYQELEIRIPSLMNTYPKTRGYVSLNKGIRISKNCDTYLSFCIRIVILGIRIPLFWDTYLQCDAPDWSIRIRIWCGDTYHPCEL